jgi:phospholipase C
MRITSPSILPLSALCTMFACNSVASSSTQDPDAAKQTQLDARLDSNGGTTPDAKPNAAIKHVFVIMMENHSWSSIKGSASAPYINSLLAQGAHAENYKTPPGNHPSEPNYIWLEAGGNMGVTDDNDPGSHHFAATDHLVTQLTAAGFTWKAYAEDISGSACPLTSSGLYGPKHTPQLFFDDVTDNNSNTSANCIAHVRPYSELAGDLTANRVANYNFLTPNLCNDMHGDLNGCIPGLVNTVRRGDDWLKAQVPLIQASQAYADHGAIFILWDEGDEPLLQTASDGPIGMIVLSANAKPGYSNNIAYDHSSTVRTMQDIFGLRPYLRGAANAQSLVDLFTSL